MANSGSDVGAIGHIRAFDAQTGKQLSELRHRAVNRTTGVGDMAEGQTQSGRRRGRRLRLLRIPGCSTHQPVIRDQTSWRRIAPATTSILQRVVMLDARTGHFAATTNWSKMTFTTGTLWFEPDPVHIAHRQEDGRGCRPDCQRISAELEESGCGGGI